MDRTESAMSESQATIGVLSLHDSKETKAILNAIEALGYRPAWLREENATLDIRDGSVTIEPDVDLVVNRLLLSNTEYPAEKLGLAGCYGAVRPILNQPGATFAAMHKLVSATRLSTAGVRVPDAFLALSHALLNERRRRFGDRAVYKTAIGTHGGGTWRVLLDEPVDPIVGQRLAFLQEFVETEGDRNRDLRVYVVDGEPIAAMYRYAPAGDWRTNVALGGDVEDATDGLPDPAAEMARRAVDVLDLDYAGVDLIRGDEGWYVLEVNPTAGFTGLYEASGVSVAPHIARLAIERAGGSVDADRVDELAETYDHSEPAVTPRRPGPTSRRPAVIGYTERVTVAGTTGSEAVVAKSDTGANRTSIDLTLAARIGAGPIKRRTRIRSGSQKTSKVRPVVDVVVGVGGHHYTVSATVEDRSHMSYPVLLGRDILEHYHVDVRRRTERPPRREE